MFLHLSPNSKTSLVNLHRSSKLKSLVLCATVVTSLGLGFKPQSKISSPPEAMLVLGGHEERERYAAQLAQQHPELPIWVSSGSPQAYAEKIFDNAGIKSDRLHLDYTASDTVTNFTTLVDELEAQGIDSVYLITSENHMQRAKTVGEIVFGSRGINFEPISVPSKNPPEPMGKVWRDGARAFLWLVTGQTTIIPLQDIDWRSLEQVISNEQS